MDQVGLDSLRGFSMGRRILLNVVAKYAVLVALLFGFSASAGRRALWKGPMPVRYPPDPQITPLQLQMAPRIGSLFGPNLKPVKNAGMLLEMLPSAGLPRTPTSAPRLPNIF